MREKILICVSASQATAAFWRAGKIVQLEQFEHDETGLELAGHSRDGPDRAECSAGEDDDRRLIELRSEP